MLGAVYTQLSARAIAACPKACIQGCHTATSAQTAWQIMMQYRSIQEFVDQGLKDLSKGPIAILLMEDSCEINSTIRHHRKLGFSNILVFGSPKVAVPEDPSEGLHRVFSDLSEPGSSETTVNTLIKSLPNRWFYYGYNGEYLFYPFCETRTVGELTSFVSEERRDSITTFVLDLYAGDLAIARNGVSLEDAFIDRTGHFALTRFRDGQQAERQLDVFGGLRWRFEDHVPEQRRRIDRVSLFRSQIGLELRDDQTFNLEEYNTFECPWHHSTSAAVCSFRAAKSLKTNPGSSGQIESFLWQNSERFTWKSQQLLDHGFIETGQWF